MLKTLSPLQQRQVEPNEICSGQEGTTLMNGLKSVMRELETPSLIFIHTHTLSCFPPWVQEGLHELWHRNHQPPEL